jgi:effector-binding domain-containing protein
MKYPLIAITTLLFVASCSNNDKKGGKTLADTLKPVRTNTVPDEKKKDEPKTAEKPGIINILDTVAPKRIVLYMKDSAKTFDRISLKLGMIYGVKLAEVLKKNNLKMASAPIAWYKTQKAPYFFEAGVAVAKKPAKLPANVFVREMGVDSVVMAHFYGPYSLLSQGYDAIKEKMKDEKKAIGGTPYEIYVGDPVDAKGKPVDPYKVRTDIVFPRH